MEFDYQNYIEQSELDLITQELLDKCEEHFKEQLKLKIKKIEADEIYLKKEKEKYWQREREYDEKIKTLKQKENELINKKEQIIFENIQTLGLDLKIGQKVYFLGRITYSEKCPRCNGTGELYFEKDDLKYKTKCPDCFYGDKRTYEYVIKESTIRRIHFSFYADNDGIKKENVCAWSGNWDYNYIMLECYIEKKFIRQDLFLTKEEAEIALKEKNVNEKK